MKKMLAILFSITLVFSIFTQNSYAATKNQFIVINKKVNELAFYQEGKLVQVYSVATGREPSLTPEGTFKIVNKIKNRPYYKKNIPGGSPKNPLGDRWLGINARGTNGDTYALHGNNNPDSIGEYASSGCVRMHNKEIHELYDMVEVGTPVIITTSSKTFDEIAENSGYTIVPTIEKFKKVITILHTAKLYNKPSFTEYTGAKLTSQSVQAYQKAGKFVQIQTTSGKKWAFVTEYTEGKRVRLDKKITIFEDTKLKKKPLENASTIATLKAKEIFAYEKIGSWYKVKTSTKPYYIKSDKVIESVKIKYKREITLKSDKPIYKKLFDKKPITTIGAQSVEAFEKIGNYYHIHSWLGPVWVKN